MESQFRFAYDSPPSPALLPNLSGGSDANFSGKLRNENTPELRELFLTPRSILFRRFRRRIRRKWDKHFVDSCVQSSRANVRKGAQTA